MRVSLFYLMDRCRVHDLAGKALSFTGLCEDIQQELLEFSREIKAARGIEYVTNDPGFIHRADPEGILWVFLLMNPEDPFRKHLDHRREMLLTGALALDPDDYAYGHGDYHYDHVAEKLQCSRSEGIYITQYWEILPVYSDRERKTINLPYLLETNGTVKSAAELYAIYALCSREEAEKVIREYLLKGSGDLSALYPGGQPEIRNGETVMAMKLSAKNGEAAWLSIKHPFFGANSPSAKRSAEVFYHYLARSIYRDVLNVAYGYRDRHIEYSGYLTTGYESRDKIEFTRRETYSYHDGGGGTMDSICISALPRMKRGSLTVPKDMMTKAYYTERKLSMPPCEGYWEDGGVLYLMNPFGMRAVFVLESIDESWD